MAARMRLARPDLVADSEDGRRRTLLHGRANRHTTGKPILLRGASVEQEVGNPSEAIARRRKTPESADVLHPGVRVEAVLPVALRQLLDE